MCYSENTYLTGTEYDNTFSSIIPGPNNSCLLSSGGDIVAVWNQGSFEFSNYARCFNNMGRLNFSLLRK